MKVYQSNLDNVGLFGRLPQHVISPEENKGVLWCRSLFFDCSQELICFCPLESLKLTSGTELEWKSLKYENSPCRESLGERDSREKHFGRGH